MKDMIGYLDTDGKLHRCESFEHLDLAWDIVVDQMNHPAINRLNAEDYLMELGWIAIRAHDVFSRIGCIKDTSSEEKYHLTQPQKDFFYKLYDSASAELRESIDELFDMDK